MEPARSLCYHRILPFPLPGCPAGGAARGRLPRGRQGALCRSAPPGLRPPAGRTRMRSAGGAEAARAGARWARRRERPGGSGCAELGPPTPAGTAGQGLWAGAGAGAGTGGGGSSAITCPGWRRGGGAGSAAPPLPALSPGCAHRPLPSAEAAPERGKHVPADEGWRAGGPHVCHVSRGGHPAGGSEPGKGGGLRHAPSPGRSALPPRPGRRAEPGRPGERRCSAAGPAQTQTSAPGAARRS